MKKLDQSNWKRKEHFEFFSKYDEPFFGIVAEVDCTQAYNISKSNGGSFFAYYLHKSLLAVNEIEEFKYRIEDEEIIIYDNINAGTTIGRNDGTFAFTFVEFDSNFNTFSDSLKKEVLRIQNSSGLGLNDSAYRKDVIHYSPIPWLKFTSLTHARIYNDGDSIPKIVFGKITEQNGLKKMPVGVHVHHGLMDGYHVSKFVDLFQSLLNS